MEIRVNIPQNDYVQPTEVREDVVQKICDVVFDNGYSYIGSKPFYGDNKDYADTAIRIAKKKGYLWFNWSMGFRLDDSFAIHVGYGKDESYSEISNS